jgi:chromosome partitioning protein
MKLAQQAQAINKELVVRLVANMVQRSTSLARELLDQLAEENPVPLLNSTLGLRTSFRDSQVYGSSVHVVPRAAAAIAEVEAMAEEVLDLLKLPKKLKGAKK